MERQNVTEIVLNISEKLKPLLKKLLPINFLRNVKRGLVDSTMANLKSESAFAQFSRTAHPDGVNLIGYVRSNIGLGQSCRLIAESLQESDINFAIYDYEHIKANIFDDHSLDYKVDRTAPYNINIVHINPLDLPLAFFKIGSAVWDSRYTVGFWLWELEKFPSQWQDSLKLVDEIWTPSEFASKSIRKATNKPVHTIPYGLTIPDCGAYSRGFFKLPDDKFLFLCMYDSGSVTERKNPIGVIKAFKRAFTPADIDVGLVIKIKSPETEDLHIINEEMSEYQNIYILTEMLEKTQVNALISCVDVFVSLHRSEGFGLVPAEAMMLGTPVIATNWSANTEFMDNDTACMVDYSLITLEKDYTPFEAGNRWADPDVEHAAGYMRKLYEDKVFYRQIADNAKAHIIEKLSPERAAMLIRNRIKEIYEK